MQSGSGIRCFLSWIDNGARCAIYAISAANKENGMLEQEISRIQESCLQYIYIVKEEFEGVSDDIPANIFMYILKIAGEIVGMFNLYDRDSARKLEGSDAEDFQKVKDAAAVAIVKNVKIECDVDLMFVDVERMLSCLCDNVYVSFVNRLEENNKSSLSDDSTTGSFCESVCEEDLHESSIDSDSIVCD